MLHIAYKCSFVVGMKKKAPGGSAARKCIHRACFYQITERSQPASHPTVSVLLR